MCAASTGQRSLARYAVLSIAGAVCTIGLKTWAYWLTGSVGMLSDALESVVNLAAAILALVVLIIAARPADEGHPFGHEKAEYFASGAEGVLILAASLMIIVSAVDRLLSPQPLAQYGVGMLIAVAASVVNYVIARILLRAGRRHGSITLEADARHLMTDVWTTAGVLAGVGAVMLTGWLWLDAAVAIAVAVNILWTGWRLLHQSVDGLMDAALPANEQDVIVQVLEACRAQGAQYHALRTRRAASRRFMTVHILVPGAWTVQQGHDLLERIEHDIRQRLDNIVIVTHLEPLEDPASWQDIGLERPGR